MGRWRVYSFWCHVTQLLTIPRFTKICPWDFWIALQGESLYTLFWLLIWMLYNTLVLFLNMFFCFWRDYKGSLDESDQFMMDPVNFMTTMMSNWTLPSHIVLFDFQAQLLRNILISHSFKEVMVSSLCSNNKPKRIFDDLISNQKVVWYLFLLMRGESKVTLKRKVGDLTNQNMTKMKKNTNHYSYNL